jgi:hypothetical protein
MTMRCTNSKTVWLAVLVAGGLVVAPGCCRWDWRGKGFGDDEGAWAQKMRPPADEKHFSGVDARAQEIERNLGVR